MKKREYTVDNTIVYDCKKEIGSDGEVDFELYGDILGNEKVDAAYEDNGLNHIHKGEESTNIPIKIDKLKEIIKEAEKEGCNYISIDYNCDHPDYTFYAFDVHVANEEEIVEHEEKEHAEYLAQTVELRKAVEKYNKEIERIEKLIK